MVSSTLSFARAQPTAAAAVAIAVVGIATILGAYYFQDLALAFMYFLMLIVLIIRPGGLLGRED